VDSHHPREHLREEPLGIAQKLVLALYASKLLEQGEGEDLRVPEPLYGLVASSMGVEQGVGVVYEAEEHAQSLFQVVEGVAMLGSGHPEFLSLRVRMAPLYRQSMQHTSRGPISLRTASPR
jgi:hypothetical protein